MKAEALIKEMQEYRAFLVGTDVIRGKPVAYTYVVFAAHNRIGGRAPRVSKKIVEQLFKEGKIVKGSAYRANTDVYALNTDLYPHAPLPYYYSLPADHKGHYGGSTDPRYQTK